MLRLTLRLTSISGLAVLLILGAGSRLASAQDTRGNGEFVYEVVDMADGADLIYARARAIDLADYPVVPSSAGRAPAIFRYGQALNRNANAISKVGDCNSVEWLYLQPFGDGQYDLGSYAYLQAVVDRYAASFAYRTYAAHNGMSTLSVLDPIWASPVACLSGESPLLCEYRLHNPSIAVIMFGSNDLLVLTPAQFDHYLRRVVHETIQAGVVPILSTFPGYSSYPDRSILFNQIVVRVALDFNIPLMNFWLALESLPAHGLDPDGYHLNGPVTRAADFTSARNLESGYPLRNLVTLQTLEVVWRDMLAIKEGQPIAR